jgi:hypothetical protein
MSGATQAARILRALVQRGERGISQADFASSPTIDGGPPVWRVPARVDELRRRGHAIETRRVRTAHGAHIAVYALLPEVAPADPSAGVNQLTPAGPEPLALDLGDAATRRPASPLDAEVV